MRTRPNDDHDVLDTYLDQMRRDSLLTRDEERELATRYRETGDRAALDRLIRGNLRLVVKIAREYTRSRPLLADLIQEGNVGLVCAVERFEPEREVKLATYASWWIRAFMLRHLMANARIVKIGTTQAQRKLFFNLRREEDRLDAQGLNASADVLATRLGASVDDVLAMGRRLGGGDASLDAPVTGSDGESMRLDTLAADPAQRPDHRVEEAELRARVFDEAVEFERTLEGRDKIVFRSRWFGEDQPSLGVIGRKFGITRERARQIEQRLLEKLRARLTRRLGVATTAVELRATGC